MPQPNPDLAAIAHMRGLGQPLLFAMDTLSKPGKAICHFVRFETIEFKDDDTFNSTVMTMVGGENDKRVDVLAKCMQGGGNAPT